MELLIYKLGTKKFSKLSEAFFNLIGPEFPSNRLGELVDLLRKYH